jgi:hypothetical protein
MTNAQGSPPVFVIGTTRSGTSVVQLALLSTKRYKGQGEGHLSPLLLHLASAVDLFWSRAKDAIQQKTAVATVKKEDVLERVYDVVRQTYAGLYGAQPFAEKTPSVDSIRVAPLLHHVWPQAKILFCRRRGLENVQSKRKKFPGQKFANLCNEWRGCMLEWQSVRPNVPSYCEIDQIEIALAPKAAGAKLGAYLGYSEAETKALGEFFAEQFPERGSDGYAPSTLEGMPWTEAERELFRTSCHPAMEAYGYRYDAAYWNQSLPTDTA